MAPRSETPVIEVPTEPELVLLPDDIHSLTFALNGVVYTLPLTLPELEADGWGAYDLKWEGYDVVWRPIDVAGDMVDTSGTHRSLLLQYREQQVVVFLRNRTEEPLLLREAVIGSINSSENWAQPAELIFPGNIMIGSHYEDVILAHGEPDMRLESDLSDLNVELLVYSIPRGDSSVSFIIDSDTRLVASISMQVL
ncbi:MAG: hypothetical protein FWE12_06840 [Oscillospiraceae bacterium]|nr:hypothetical protein [Oscillospiraceae bacterium]